MYSMYTYIFICNIYIYIYPSCRHALYDQEICTIVCTKVYACLCKYTYMHIYMCTYMCVCIYVYMYMHTYIHIYTYIHICTYTHVGKHYVGRYFSVSLSLSLFAELR